MAGARRLPVAEPAVKTPLAADELAVERTALANERTMLAYVRTALGLAGAGFPLIHFFPLWPIGSGGFLLSALGFATLALGAVRFWKTRRRTLRLRELLTVGMAPCGPSPPPGIGPGV